MTTETASAVAAAEHADAAAIDAAAQAAETARLAAEAAVAASATAAANAEQTAAEKAAQLEQKTAAHIAEQQDELSWLKTHAAETKTALESQSSALITIAAEQAKHREALAAMAARLTPPPSPEPTQTTNPENAAEEGHVEAKTGEPEAQRKRHRWI